MFPIKPINWYEQINKMALIFSADVDDGEARIRLAQSYEEFKDCWVLANCIPC